MGGVMRFQPNNIFFNTLKICIGNAYINDLNSDFDTQIQACTMEDTT